MENYLKYYSPIINKIIIKVLIDNLLDKTTAREFIHEISIQKDQNNKKSIQANSS